MAPCSARRSGEIRAVVRQLVDDQVRPHVADWYEEGRVPVRELAAEFGKLGLLGMHLTGYGCAGASRGRVRAGLPGAGGRRLRRALAWSRVQGSLAMYAIWRYGREEQKQRWLPPMAAGEAIGCFGLTEPDHGSDPASMATRARRDGDDWVLTGGKMWITNAPVADVAVIWARTDEGVRGFVVPMDTPGVTAREIRHKMSLRASSTGEIVLDDVRLPGRRPAARRARAEGAAVLPDRGAVRHRLGRARRGPRLPGDRDRLRARPGAVRPPDRRLPAHPGQARRHGASSCRRATCWRCTWAGWPTPGRLRPEQVSVGKLNNVREALAIARQCRTILGANGISGEYPVLRHANNLESVLTYEGTSEIHQLVIGQQLTGLSAFV